MSEKEEKIAVVSFKGDFLRTQADWSNKKSHHTSLKNVFGMTRSEAVERMANVFYDFCEGCKTYEEYERLAEAALDALMDK